MMDNLKDQSKKMQIAKTILTKKPKSAMALDPESAIWETETNITHSLKSFYPHMAKLSYTFVLKLFAKLTKPLFEFLISMSSSILS